MIVVKEKEIDGLTFQVTKMSPYGEGLKILLKVSKYFSEPLNECLHVIKDADTDKMDMSDIIAVGITKYLSNICPDKIEEITKDLVNPVKIKVKKENGEITPLDTSDLSYQQLIKLLIFSIEINYASFFLGLPDLMKEVMESLTKASEEKNKKK